MISIFYIAVATIPFIAITNGYTGLLKLIKSPDDSNSSKINISLLPSFGDILMIMLLAAFVIAYSCGSSG